MSTPAPPPGLAPRAVTRPSAASVEAPAAPPAAPAATREAGGSTGSAPAPRVVRPAPRRRQESRGAAIDRPAPPPVREEETAPGAAVRPAPEAAPTLEQANAARGAGRHAEALSLYSRVIDAHPGSAQAQAARVAAADLALEHLHDSGRARQLYAEAARRGGALAAEARFGLAAAERARGDRRAELVALDEFLRRHPDHALARIARQRRAELAR